jgi:hypothetical protein
MELVVLVLSEISQLHKDKFIFSHLWKFRGKKSKNEDMN